jgi:hypothetical protein
MSTVWIERCPACGSPTGDLYGHQQTCPKSPRRRGGGPMARIEKLEAEVQRLTEALQTAREFGKWLDEQWEHAWKVEASDTYHQSPALAISRTRANTFSEIRDRLAALRTAGEEK